jgi:hypothetical protein
MSSPWTSPARRVWPNSLRVGYGSPSERLAPGQRISTLASAKGEVGRRLLSDLLPPVRASVLSVLTASNFSHLEPGTYIVRQTQPDIGVIGEFACPSDSVPALERPVRPFFEAAGPNDSRISFAFLTDGPAPGRELPGRPASNLLNVGQVGKSKLRAES